MKSRPFKCLRCGNCCRGDGFVSLSEEDVARAAAYLEIGELEFLEEYCQPFTGEYPALLKDQDDEEQSCIFLTQDLKSGIYGCQIHKAKPQQCADFPFTWRPRNIRDFCDGFRAAEGLPPTKRKTMS